jgi:hypothetical protein
VLEFLKTLDRRWIFLAMLLAVAVPILAQKSFPEKPTKLVQDAFDAIEDLDEGSNVLLSFDYSPSSDGELAPMATALVRHCCLKRHKMFFMTLWPDGLPLLNRTIEAVVETEFADQKFEYGKDYVNLGYNPGREVAIIVMGTNLRKMFPSDVNEDDLDDIPLTANISSLQDMKLIIDITTGNPGAKEWVQYAASPFQGTLKLVVGATAVQAICDALPTRFSNALTSAAKLLEVPTNQDASWMRSLRSCTCSGTRPHLSIGSASPAGIPETTR